MEYILIAVIIFIIWTIYLDKTVGQEWRDTKADPFHKSNRRRLNLPDFNFYSQDSNEDILSQSVSATVDVELQLFLLAKKQYFMTITWQLKRRKRLKHDNYTCQSCDATGVKLEVHHTKGYNLIPNEGLECIVSLCRFCHQKEHDIHGYPKGYDGYMTWNHPITKGL